MRLKSLLITAILFAASLLLAEIAPETVLAEHSQGNITMGYMNQRLDQIPVMYQGRYQTYEGRVKFLNDLVTEEVFYLQAMEFGLENDPQILKKADNQIQSTYYTLYQDYLKENEIKIEEGELYEYFLENLEEYPGITFDEAKTMVENKYRAEKSKEFFAEYNQQLLDKYEIEIITEVLDSLDFADQNKMEKLADQKYIASKLPELEKTVAELYEFYEGLPARNRRPFLQQESLLNSVNEMVKMALYTQEALAAGFDTNEEVLATYAQIKRNLMLRETYNRLVTEKIDVSEPILKEFYDNNLEKFSTKPSRKIQAFGFNDSKTAKKARKKVKKALKKDDMEMLEAVLAESVFEFPQGELDHIYKNDIIPKFGKDSLWCDLVWEEDYGKTDPEDLSEVFVNAQGNHVFFRVVEDNVPVATPFEEARIRIENEMRQNKSREIFDAENLRLKEKYEIVIYEDNLVEKLSAEEYFSNAENAQKKRRYKDAIYYYDQICKYYKNGADDYKALFMKGFLYSEEMKDAEKAIAVFEELLEEYPQGELHDSARFMIDELNGNSNILEKMEENQ